MTLGERARQEQLERAAFDLRWREQRGWEGPSPLASPEERSAYQALQVIPEIQAGRATVADLPESYGGRPTGTSRRAMRMAAEWDAAQQTALENQRLMQQVEQERQQMSFAARDQQIQEEEAGWKREAMLTAQDIRHRTNQHVSGFMAGIRGGVDADGKEIPPLDPESPDYPKRITELSRNFPLARENPEIQPIISAMDSIYNARLSADKERAAAREETESEFAKTTQSLLEAGVAEEDLPQYFDTSENVPAGVRRYDPLKVARQLGTVEAQKRTKQEEAPVKNLELDIKQKSEELNSMLTAPSESRPMNFEDTATKLRSEIEGLRARYSSVTGGKAAPKFAARPQNKQQYDSLPAGTPYIGRDGKERIKQ